MTDINVPPRDFKVGDEVYCLNYGHGKVSYINNNSSLPILVNYANGNNNFYTENGKLNSLFVNRCLFHADENVQVTVKRNIADPVEYKMQNLESKIEALEELIKHAVITRIKKYKGFNL